MYAKLLNGNLILPKINEIFNGLVYSNPTDEILQNIGFKQVIDNVIEDRAGFKKVQTITEDSSKIYINYSYVAKEVINEELPTDNHYIYTAVQYETEENIINGYEATAKEVVEDTRPSITELQYLVASEEITASQVLIHWTIADMTNEEKVNYLENKYQMPRLLRECILSVGSDYNKLKAQEIENYAVLIRGNNA